MNNQQIENLNKMLANAQEAQAKWERFINGKSFEEYKDDQVEWGLRGAKDILWSQLCQGIREAAPIKFVDEEGEEKVIGAVGILTADKMLWYSKKVNSQFCEKGQRVDRIKLFKSYEIPKETA